MKQCPQCGSSCNDLDAVCSYCGFSFEPPAGNYGTPPPAFPNYAPAVQKTNSMAIASLILGIVSVPLMCCCVGIITAILAVIFGFLARNKIAASNGLETGNGMALAGIITGFAVIGLTIIMIIVTFAGGSSGSMWDQIMKSYQQELQRQMGNMP